MYKLFKTFLLTFFTVLVIFSFLSVSYAQVYSGGTYVIGSDLPEGFYTISLFNHSITLRLWGKKSQDYTSYGGLLLSTIIDEYNPILGKVELKLGNILEINSDVNIEEYSGLVIDIHEKTSIPSGRYCIGTDIPAGLYSIYTEQQNVSLTVWGSEYEDYEANGGLLANLVIKKDRESTVLDLHLDNIIDFNRPLMFELIDPYIQSAPNPLEQPTYSHNSSNSGVNAISILENNTINWIISSCPSLTNITKDTQDYYESVSTYYKTFPNQDGKIHTWIISIQTGVITFGDEKYMTVLTVKPKGTATEIASVLKWEISLLEALPSIIDLAEENGVELRVEKRVNGGDYAIYADANGIIDLMDKEEYNALLEAEHHNLSLLEVVNAFGEMGSLDTNGNGKLDPEELFGN